MTVVMVGPIFADGAQDKWIRIDVTRWRRDAFPLWNVGPGDDERHAGDFLVHGRLAPEASCTEIVSMIRGIEHTRVVPEPQHIERAQHLADVVVDEGAQAV